MPVAARTTVPDPLAQLIGEGTRARAVRALVFNPPDTLWTSATLAAAIGCDGRAASRTLRAFATAGVVQAVRRRRGAYQLVPARAETIRTFVYDMGMPDLTQWSRTLPLAQRVRMVVATGILVPGSFRTPDREVDELPDLLIVTARQPEVAMFRRPVRALERLVGRELVVALMSADEFTYRRSVNDRLVREVFERPHRVVRGNRSASHARAMLH